MNGIVSIVIPLFNRETLFLETVRSVMDQTYSNFECIVVDDGSTDNSIESVREFCGNDTRFQVSRRSSPRKGACVCRNEGIQKATGQYLMFLDSDDLLDKECLAHRVKRFQEHPDCDFIVNQIGMFDHASYKVTKLWSSLKQADDLHGFVNAEGWQTSSTFFKTAFVKHYEFDEAALSWQDVDFHLRIMLDHPVYVKFPDAPPDVFKRVSGMERISNSNISFSRIESRLNLYGKLEGIMDGKGYHEYGYPFLVYHFKFLEIAALKLSYAEFRKLFSIWKKSKTYTHPKAPFYKVYLLTQAQLHRLRLRWLSSGLYRVMRLFVSRKLLRSLNRKILLEKPQQLAMPGI